MHLSNECEIVSNLFAFTLVFFLVFQSQCHQLAMGMFITSVWMR